MENITGKIYKKIPLTGGDINEVYLLESEKGRFVEKRNNNVPGDFFTREAAGLELLKNNGLSVPKVLAAGENFLLLEYLAPGKKQEENAGRQLAMLHSIRQKNYGLDYNNYIGSIRQENGIFSSWSEFYIKRRIEPQLKMYFKARVDKDQDTWNKLYSWIEKNIHPDYPSLLHGDIWSGNLYYSDQGPCFIDPAVYCGHYMVDLAFSELFGGFGVNFYSAYNEIKPIDKNYPELIGLYQIYPLLVHANLFGGGYYSSALGQAMKYI